MAQKPIVASQQALARTAAKPKDQAGTAEARLLDVYRLIGHYETRTALERAERLVSDYPNFALAQLVYGDLLSSRVRSVTRFGDVPANQLKGNVTTLSALRSESEARLKALRERPPAGFVPAEFVLLSHTNKHAIAVDAARSRLYLFENRDSGVTLIADYYISIGKLGVEKNAEGDQRTPLGVYFITSQLDPKTLKDFYGAGALPINYPNVLDIRRGKTGGGIWLHGTPSDQFSRPPQDSDGCVVLANPDLKHIIQTVAIRSTPVVIANQLTWVPQDKVRARATPFEARLSAWREAKSSGDLIKLNTFYASDLSADAKTKDDWQSRLAREVAQVHGRELQIKDLSLLQWQDKEDTMVVTFGEVIAGQRTGTTVRQYWSRRAGQWTIFYEGDI
ncbi:L,D-transpeptidase family protein [Rhodoferax sp.]|uniref:L,D-transpeptidase family protein n=1 Tax=Rhodoferax sp. TaxID=50421 RepID=UPI00283D2EBD|nr:L,D-transpeptidase family protein [Rhodoferax sp.]MDR3369590.1 L,D-transpeptidase family protein [Rhodoferax sp.]